ncbi:MAG TPA: ClpXP protease specificity-enhancing factor SspB [Xanthobacteraceae bacterium]|jgi:hypothetical protein
MGVNHIRYDILAQEALRGVVHRVLADVAKNGLPGEHYFYISFDTKADGVRVSPRLLGQYPDEMTIVLQHQFWDLRVGESGFEVGLSFGGIPERLNVPFAAVKGFFDPSVQFGLQFEEIGNAGEEVEPARRSGEGAAGLDAAEPSVAGPGVLAVPPPANLEPGHTPREDAPKPAGAEVVRIDRFRKK